MSVYAKKLKELKDKKHFSIGVGKYTSKLISLRVLNTADLDNNILIAKLSHWRRRESYWFASKFNISNERTRIWLRDTVIGNPDRILFAIEDNKSTIYGHAGFYRYRAKDNSCELDNVVRGEKDIPGLITDCVKILIAWGFENLGVDSMYLTTFDDNLRAVNLYKRCGFKKIRRISLKQSRIGDEIQWVKISDKSQKPERFYARMKLK